MVSEVSRLVGATPAAAVRPVSLAVRAYLQKRRGNKFALAVAVSGGADSTALAVAALDQALRAGIPVTTLTVDHQIRPESAAEAETVAQQMRHLGAGEAKVLRPGPGTPAHTGAGCGPEGDARNLRYHLLQTAAADFAADHGMTEVDLLLGHTADDQAETVLLGLGRGSGARSLSAMRARQPLRPGVDAVRPLLALRRADTAGFCEALGLTAVDDPSNYVDGPWRTADGAPLRRAAVRQGALPALSDALGQDVVPALTRTAQLLADDDDALETWAARLFEGETDSLDVQTLRGAPAAVRRRALRQLCLAAGVPGASLGFTHLRDLEALAVNSSGQGAVSLPHRHVGMRDNGRIRIGLPD